MNDANAIAGVLRNDLGFTDVRVMHNVRRRDLIDAVARFGDAARGADAAVFYFSGHGQQQAKSNFLLPVDARIERPEHVKSEGLDADHVLAALEAAKPRVSLLVLDACRDNPFGPRARSSSKGLARPRDPEEGMLIAFATRDGEVALDGAGNNSPYAQALVAAFKSAASTPVQQMFDNIGDHVRRSTEGKQRPVRYGDLKVNVYLVNPPREVKPASSPVQSSGSEADGAACEVARSVNTESAWRTYLREFPGGRCVAAARVALTEVSPSQRPNTLLPPTALQASSPPTTPAMLAEAGTAHARLDVVRLEDDFSSEALRSGIWNASQGPGGISVNKSDVRFGAGSCADTRGKLHISAPRIVITARFSGPKPSGRDSNVALVDIDSGDRIQIGDTNYYSWGLYLQGTGRYNLVGSNKSRGASTSGINLESSGRSLTGSMHYRIEIDGDRVSVQRGPTANAWEETLVRTMKGSIVGRTFYLRIGTGGNDGYYSPAHFSFISLSTR